MTIPPTQAAPDTDPQAPEPTAPAAAHLTDLAAIRRSAGLTLLVLLTIGLYFARDVVLPLMIGTLLALALSPTVRWLQRLGLPPVATASALILCLALMTGLFALVVSTPVSDWIADAPRLEAELKGKLRAVTSSVAVVQKASEEVDKLSAGTTDPTVQKVAIQSPGLLSVAVGSAVSIISTTLVTLVLALFLLASGDLFYVKVIEAFPRFGDKKRALRIIYGIERAVARYLMLVIVINAGLGCVIGSGLWAIGMPRPAVWAVVAFLLNFLPFIGPLLGAGLAGAVAIVSFDSLGHAALAPVIYLTATSIEGQFLTPVLLGRQLELNTVSVFVTVVFWGWLWGIAGALMAVPFLVCLKVICDNVESMSTLGNFLNAAAPAPEK